MSYGYSAARINDYQASSNAAVLDADPHRLISMLYDGALERLAQARYGIGSRDVPLKLRAVNGFVGIVEYLRLVLDRERGGEISERLDALYDYMLRSVANANLTNDVSKMDELAGLLREIKAGWDGIAETPEARRCAAA